MRTCPDCAGSGSMLHEAYCLRCGGSGKIRSAPIKSARTYNDPEANVTITVKPSKQNGLKQLVIQRTSNNSLSTHEITLQLLVSNETLRDIGEHLIKNGRSKR